MPAAILALLGRVPLRIWLLAGALVAGALYHWHAVSAAYDRGYAVANAACAAEALKAELAAKNRDLAAARAAADASREAARANAAAMMNAEQKAQDYVDELAKRGEDARCRADSRDVLRMRPYPVTPAARP